MIKELYVASGCIASNPSAIGATYASRLVRDRGSNYSNSGVISALEIEYQGVVTNNQAEMYAMLDGLRRLPEGFRGTVYSRSQVTLMRVFGDWQWKDIPSWMHRVYQVYRMKLINWQDIQYALVDPKNEHYKFCKRACRLAGESYMATIGANNPTTLEAELAL